MRAAFVLIVFSLCVSLSTTARAASNLVPPTAREVEAAIRAGRHYLETTQRDDGAIADPRNPLFEMWETVEAATALVESGSDRDAAVQRALAFLRSNENADGLICHNRSCRASYCLETTSEYFRLLARVEGAAAIRPRLAVVASMQKPSGEWTIGNPAVREQPSFPSVTAFVVAMLDSGEFEPPDRNAAFDWLLSRQSAAGDWGQSWEYYGCPAYELWPVLRGLSAANSPAARAALEKAEVFMRDSQLPDGSWHFVDPTRPKGTSPGLQTALMLSALRYGDPLRNRAAIERGISFLLARQRQDGGWNGGDFPINKPHYQKQEHVFVSARAVSVLAWYRDRIGGRR